MQIFGRSKPRDVLFLMPVRLNREKPHKSKIRMLYCDAAGKIYASMVRSSTYDIARVNAERITRSHRSFATVGLEISPGNFVPATVEISSKELWALEHITEHAVKNGRLPDLLKKYIEPIIELGKAGREAVISEYTKRKPMALSGTTPKVLNRLPYYREGDIEISMPIYKAEHSYPLVILKRLPNRNGDKNSRNMLILDNDGDLAIIKVLAGLVTNMEKKLAEQSTKKNRNVCAVISQNPKGMSIDYITVSQQQKRALDTLTRYFEETGNGKRPISASARTVLSRAKDKATTPDR